MNWKLGWTEERLGDALAMWERGVSIAAIARVAGVDYYHMTKDLERLRRKKRSAKNRRLRERRLAAAAKHVVTSGGRRIVFDDRGNPIGSVPVNGGR